MFEAKGGRAVNDKKRRPLGKEGLDRSIKLTEMEDKAMQTKIHLHASRQSKDGTLHISMFMNL